VRYKFEDIAINSIAKRKPTDEDMKTYIGLEHLDANDLRVTRFGSKVPIKGEKLLMTKGDILFGRRNTYLKRAAIAPHDGLFSAHGMILRPKEKVIAKEFFPFFISSDYFLNEAIRISVGSISPTVNWGTLKTLEFELPLLNEQRQLSKILWAFIETRNAYKTLLFLTENLVKSRFVEMFGDPVTNPMGWEVNSLSDIAECFIGLTYKPDDVKETGIIVLRSGNIQNGKLDFTNVVRVTTDIKEKLFVRKDDILMCSRNGSEQLVGKVAIIPDELNETMTFGAFMTIIRSKYSHYLLSFFRSKAFFEQITTAKTSTINQITKSMLDVIRVPVPPLSLQNCFAEFVKQADKSKFAALRQTKVATLLYNDINGG